MIPIRDFFFFNIEEGKYMIIADLNKVLNICQVSLQKAYYVLTHFLPLVPVLQVRKQTGTEVQQLAHGSL